MVNGHQSAKRAAPAAGAHFTVRLPSFRRPCARSPDASAPYGWRRLGHRGVDRDRGSTYERFGGAQRASSRLTNRPAKPNGRIARNYSLDRAENCWLLVAADQGGRPSWHLTTRRSKDVESEAGAAPAGSSSRELCSRSSLSSSSSLWAVAVRVAAEAAEEVGVSSASVRGMPRSVANSINRGGPCGEPPSPRFAPTWCLDTPKGLSPVAGTARIGRRLTPARDTHC
jgi:hypothetical protein